VNRERDRGQYEEAEQLARDAARNGEQVPGWSRDHWRTAEARSLRGEALVCLQRYDEAEPILLEAYETLERRIPRPRRQRTLSRTAKAIVDLYRATDRPDEAKEWQAILEEL
jgi:tetratricopeptide (TPR) repeat protein